MNYSVIKLVIIGLCLTFFTTFSAEVGADNSSTIARISYYDTGEIREYTPLKEGITHGCVKLYYRSGVICKEINYIDGKQHGKYTCYNEIGEIRYEENDENDITVDDSRNGLIEIGRRDHYSNEYDRTLFKEGKIIKQYFFNVDGGDVKTDHLIRTVSYSNGLKHGTTKHYSDGRKGVDEKGWLTGTDEWVNGFRHGISKRYYENGDLEWELSYICGEQHGIDRSFYHDGKIEREVEYKFGKKHGPEIYRNEKGEITKSIQWDMGVEIKPENGQKK